MVLKAKELLRRIQLEGLEETAQHLMDCLLEGVLSPDDFSIRQLAEAFVCAPDGTPCGREWINSFNPTRGESISMEATSGLETTAFTNLTGQLIFSTTMKAAQAAEFIYPKLERTVSSKLRKELIPGVTGITEDILGTSVGENMPYPEVGFGEDYIETSPTVKQGRILSLTKEILFFDKTGLVLEMAKKIGELLGITREKSFCRMLAGIVNNYKWRGTTYNTYQTSAPWINVTATNGISVTDGWTKIDAAEQKFNGMLDPNTSEPVMYGIKEIVHCPGRTHQFRRVIGASVIRDRGANTAASSEIEGPNTVQSYPLLPSRYLKKVLVDSGVAAADAEDYWFAGDAKEAFAWVENWPITTVQAAANSEAEFERDIVARWKTSQMGVHQVMEPRAETKNYQA